MKQTWHSHSTFRVQAGDAKILTDPCWSDNAYGSNGWNGYFTGKTSTPRGDQ